MMLTLYKSCSIISLKLRGRGRKHGLNHLSPSHHRFQTMSTKPIGLSVRVVEKTDASHPPSRPNLEIFHLVSKSFAKEIQKPGSSFGVVCAYGNGALKSTTTLADEYYSILEIN